MQSLSVGTRTDPQCISLKPDIVGRYRHLVSCVDRSIINLDGGERSYNVMWTALIKLDAFCTRTLKTPKDREQLEIHLATTAGIANPSVVTIGGFLLRAAEQYERILQGASTSLFETIERLSKLGVIVKKSTEVFVETDPELEPSPTGTGGGWKKPEYSPRLEQLIAGLQEFGVHKEHIIITVGEVRAEMVRSQPYVLVEIPMLGRDILVCNEVGEITFVNQISLGAAAYAGFSKEALKALPTIHTVRYASKAQWLEEIGSLLFKDRAARLPPIMAREVETLRRLIIDQNGISPESWVAMGHYSARKAFRLPNSSIGLRSMATVFRIDGNPVGNKVYYYRLGERIFGCGTVISETLQALIQNRETNAISCEALALRIREDPEMSPQVWAEMNQKTRLTYKAPKTSLGLYAIAARFGIPGNPTHFSEFHFLLGEKIFGPDGINTTKLRELREDQAKRTIDNDELIQRIRQDPGMTAAQWVKMSTQEKHRYRAPGTNLQMHAIATRLGIEPDKESAVEKHLLLGQKIFEDPLVTESLRLWREEQEKNNITEEEILQRIKSAPGMTPEVWADMTRPQASAYHVPNSTISLFMLANRVGIMGERNYTTEVHYELGELIFGSGTVIGPRLEILREAAEKNKIDAVEVMSRIKAEAGMSAERWVAMTPVERSNYQVPGTTLGQQALTFRLGVSGNLISTLRAHYQVGEKIFGPGTIISTKLKVLEEQRAQSKLSTDELRLRIVGATGMSPEAWVNMSPSERHSYRVPGTALGIVALSKRWGVKGNAQSSYDAFFELGERIFGLDTVVSERRKQWRDKVAKNQISVDDLVQRIKEAPGMSQDKWTKMSQKERIKYKVPGTTIGLHSVATRLGISGDPLHYKQVFEAIGQKLYGAEK